MKTLFTLFVALVACSFLFAQNPVLIQAGPSARAGSLNHADSLVLREAALQSDSVALMDSLSRMGTRTLPFPEAIEAILHDFPHNLQSVSGELLLAEGEYENYASTILLPNAASCIVTRYHSKRDTTASWQARMYSSDDFGKAALQYRALFGKLQGSYLLLADNTQVFLKGKFEPAREETPFTTSTLRLPAGDWRYADVKVELELVYLLADWAVNINIVSKKPDEMP
ncbi:hypothetical protein ACX0G9_21680 [Flavitalea flava]